MEIELEETLIIFMILSNETPTLKRKPLRILNQWVEDKEEKIDFSKKVKGVLLVNYLRQVDPRKRTSIELDKTTEKYAIKRNFTIIDTSQLYTAYCNMVETKIMTQKDFIQTIVNNSGIITERGLDIKAIF